MVGVQALFVNFFMRSTKRYLNGKYSDFPSQSPYVRPRSTIYSTKRGASPSFLYGSPLLGYVVGTSVNPVRSKFYPQIHLGHFLHKEIPYNRVSKR